ncbi:translocation/assembly module TamB [Allosphingosinicella flava]|uniref:Translocation/assembly module TamB n=1 Tax=Allosphingosinicella flava TaxID=2771430 RepID=A0A7T2GHI8_9SPHN|nr:translocation/assembly module TamB [Sphingosinicella flava]QPQ54001.1 translocation/assembly module TamB [Sphingosinicella flava]
MGEAPRPGRRKAHLLVRLGRFAFAFFVAALLGITSFLVYLDTEAGHRFIAKTVAEQAPRSGFRIRIGAIEGSIWGETRLKDVRLYDPQGLFAQSPEVALDWEPIGWVANRLHINTFDARLVILHRLPKFRPSVEPRPILPGFDLWIDRLRVEELRIGPAVTGRWRSGTLQGRADIRDGRALIDLDAVIRDGGDRLALLLDAQPDADRFDLDVQLDAPANSLTGAIVGTKRPIRLAIEGDGTWTKWSGRALLDLSGRRSADLRLGVEAGRYGLSGALAPAQFLKGKLMRLSAPRIDLKGAGTFEDRRLDGRLSLRSAALKVEAAGIVDLAGKGFDNVRLGVDLLRPAALFPNMTGNRIRLAMTLDGPFGTAAFSYRATAPRVAFDDTGFEDVRAEGRGRLSDPPVAVPIRFTARRVTGVGSVAGGILANLRVDGLLKVTARALTGESLSLTSDKLKGKVSLFVDLVTGRYDVVLSGGLTRYSIPGLGIVDVTSELKVVPGANGRGTIVTGTGKAWVRRLDNKFLASLAGGLPRIETGLLRGADGVIHFRNLRLRAPKIAINGNGYRRRDGTFHFEGRGNQADYGPFSIVLDGDISRPRVTLRLDRPNEALGIRDMDLTLQPNAGGYAYEAAGLSTLGPFTSKGAILLPANAPAVIAIDALQVSGTSATGRLRSDPGGFQGQLNISGGGLRGGLLFQPAGGIQRIEAHLVADQARFAGPPAIAIRRGRLDGVILLDPNGTSIEGTLEARGVTRGAVSLASISASASLRGGSGQIRADVAGTRGRTFTFAAVADVTPQRIGISGRGSVDRRPIALKSPAILTRAGDGWNLAPTAITFAGGSAEVGGMFNSARTQIDARLDAMPLTVLDIAYPDLGLGGIASGTLRYDVPAGGGAPKGDLNLRVRGLTRAGIVLSTAPVDLGIAAKLDGRNAALRAVAASQGRTIGRAQARLSPLPDGGTLIDRLSAAPLFAQIRYNGPADTLWGLTGVELFNISGPVALGADVTGTLNDPAIRGSLRAQQARLESAITGTVVQNLAASGRFDGSRLLLDSFSGTTKNDGRVSGRGSFLLSARGLGIDLTVDANRAQILDRDDLKAKVTGPIRIRSDGDGGTISGDLNLVSGLFRLGSATAAAQVPRLPVREVNGRDDDWTETRTPSPWQFDMAVRARNGLQVTGLGISSEWSANLSIDGPVTAPRINGRADLVRGSYDFAGRTFDLERGVIRFVGDAPPDPILDIVAQGGVQGLNATIRVTGSGLRPEIAFTSTPPLPQDELLSRLLFGTSITNLSAPEALQLAAAVAALNNPGAGLDPINAVRSAVGLDRLRILPGDIVTGQGTSLAAGKYLGRRFYVEVVTDGRGYSATRIEYQITRWLSLLSSVSTIGRHNASVRVSKDY